MKDPEILELRCGYCNAPIKSNGLKCSYCNTEHIKAHEPITLGVNSTGSYPIGVSGGRMGMPVSLSVTGGKSWSAWDGGLGKLCGWKSEEEAMKDARYIPIND